MAAQSGSLQLFVTTHGSYLHVKDALFELRQKTETGEWEKRHFAARKVRSIVFTVNGALSTEAVRLALEHHIDILFARSDGHPLGRVWHSRPGSTVAIRKRQLEASLGPEAVRHTVDWLGRKLAQQSTLLTSLGKHRRNSRDALAERAGRIDALRLKVLLLAEAHTIAEIADTLRGLEGTAGRLYFETLSQMLPPDYRFAGRSFRPAVDAFNAFLNYAYGVLYGRVEKALLLAGIDPFVGFLHRDDYNHRSMVYDFIEPYRIHADYTVFRLFSGKKVNRSQLREITGGVALEKEGKQLLLAALVEYLDEKRIRYRGRNQTRGQVLQQEAHAFANELLGRAAGSVEIQNLDV